MIGGSASFFLAPIIGATIASAWGWRSAFTVLAVPTIVFGVVFYILLGQRMPAEKVDHIKTSTQGEAPATPGRLRRLVAFMILSTFNAAAFFSTIPFIPLFLVDHHGISKETAAALLALIYSAGFWASPLGGYLSDRWGKAPVVLAVCFISGPVIYLINVVPYQWGIVALLLITGMIMYVRMPVSEAYILSHTSERHRSTVLGIYFFGSLEGGGVITPVLGYLVDQFGFYPTFAIAGAAVVVVTLLCSIWLWASRD